MLDRGLRRALSIREVLIIISCVVVCLVLFRLFFWGVNSRLGRNEKSVKDATQLRGIHQSWLIFSRDFGGIYPTPGLVARLPDPVMGTSMPG